jgi:uncharacterized iron-regulated protein
MLKHTLITGLVAAAFWHATTAAMDSAAAALAPIESTADLPPVSASPVLQLDAFSTLEGILPRLTDARVLFIGEHHTRYDHHLIQLEIIRHLHRQGEPLAIGMEMFQQPFQSILDDYVAGRIGVNAMLRDTEYYRRWRLDYRHYAPILEYAREHGLPLVALNVPTELTRAVGRSGFDGLAEDQRKALPPDMRPADEAYRQRIRAVFDLHPNDGQQPFEHFLQAQLLWDEGMAARAASFLDEHPGHRLVVLAGNQHVAWGSTMPQRLQRRLAVPVVSILNSWEGTVGPGLADFLLMPAERALPPPGRIGALLDDEGDKLTITACMPDGACAEHGLKRRDRIVAIDRIDTDTIADLRLALWNKQPGDTISIDIVRNRLLLPDRNFSYELTLK